MFAFTDFDKQSRLIGREWKGSLPGVNPRSTDAQVKQAVIDASFVEILERRTSLLRRLYCEGDVDPSTRVIVSQRAVHEAFDQAGIFKREADAVRRLTRQHLGREFVISDIKYDVPGNLFTGSLVDEDELYTAFFITVDMNALNQAASNPAA